MLMQCLVKMNYTLSSPASWLKQRLSPAKLTR